jgi:hypothetical protein
MAINHPKGAIATKVVYVVYVVNVVGETTDFVSANVVVGFPTTGTT